MPGNPSAPPSLDWQHVRVLVVDDHRMYRLLLSTLLERLGVAHQACENGLLAVQAMTAQRFDLVISDCRMPVMDGYALTREIRRREQQAGHCGIPVIALSGSLTLDDVRLCKASGMDAWLVKPLSLEQLHDVLQYWLSNPVSGHNPVPTRWRHSQPSRNSLIAAFGAWEVVESMLFNLLQEAYADLTALILARARLDTAETAHRLHRLVGSVAFLGTTDLEPRAIELITQVNQCGVALRARELEQFQQDIEEYLQRLADL